MHKLYRNVLSSRALLGAAVVVSALAAACAWVDGYVVKPVEAYGISPNVPAAEEDDEELLDTVRAELRHKGYDTSALMEDDRLRAVAIELNNIAAREERGPTAEEFQQLVRRYGIYEPALSYSQFIESFEVRSLDGAALAGHVGEIADWRQNRVGDAVLADGVNNKRFYTVLSARHAMTLDFVTRDLAAETELKLAGNAGDRKVVLALAWDGVKAPVATRIETGTGGAVEAKAALPDARLVEVMLVGGADGKDKAAVLNPESLAEFRISRESGAESPWGEKQSDDESAADQAPPSDYNGKGGNRLFADDLFAEMNRWRARLGMNPLVRDDALDLAAGECARDKGACPSNASVQQPNAAVTQAPGAAGDTPAGGVRVLERVEARQPDTMMSQAKTDALIAFLAFHPDVKAIGVGAKTKGKGHQAVAVLARFEKNPFPAPAEASTPVEGPGTVAPKAEEHAMPMDSATPTPMMMPPPSSDSPGAAAPPSADAAAPTKPATAAPAAKPAGDAEGFAPKTKAPVPEGEH